MQQSISRRFTNNKSFMPHIDIKCYPKHLSQTEFESFIIELTQLAEKHLHANEGDISINYTEIPADQWKALVWDREILPQMKHLAKKPGYCM
jgi:4-oxalocrotonate tautomerase